jgi:hypothetical protein
MKHHSSHNGISLVITFSWLVLSLLEPFSLQVSSLALSLLVLSS